jgi:hypothetical protein
VFQIAFVFLVAGVTLGSQHDTNVVKTTLCDLYQHPEQYSGRMVEVRATVAGNDMWIDTFTTVPCPAYLRVIVVFPDRVRPMPGFKLVRDKSFKEFEEAFYAPRPNHIDATFEGRFDAAFVWRDHKRVKIGSDTEQGYGKKHRYDAQIVLHQVSDVTFIGLPRK